MARGPARTSLEATALLCAVVALAWFTFRQTLYRPASPAPPPAAAPAPAPAAAPATGEAIVVAVVGDVVRISPAGVSSGLLVGQKLHAEDSLRTGQGAHTDLRVGPRDRVTLAESSQLTVREISERVHRFKLSHGRVAVDYEPDRARLLRIETDVGDAAAETQGAHFSVLSTGTTVAIATESGNVSLRSQNATVSVAAGHEAVAAAGEPPSAAEPIPAKLLLKVADAQRAEGLCADVAGTAPAGAEVLVDGAPAAVDQDGRFHVRVPKSKDKAAVLVATRDVAGRETTKFVPCQGAGSLARIKDFAIRWKKRGPR